MRLTGIVLSAFALLFGAPVASAQTGASAGPLPQSVAGPALNPSLFAPGAVQDRVETYGRWMMMCREAAALRQRFCSLRSAAALARGGVMALTVTTTDDGRPAGLLQLPLGLVLSSAVEIAPLGVPPATAKKATARVGMVSCDAQGCGTVFLLSPLHLAALSGGKGLVVRFKALARDSYDKFAFAPLAKASQIEVEVGGEGFAVALKSTAAR